MLEEIGIDFRDDAEALAMWKEAGADVKGERVRFPKGLVRSLLKTAPREFTQHARNPERNVEIGGNNTVFAPVYGPPFVRDLDEGRRYATIEDFRNFVKLAYLSPSMHHSGGTVCEPVDVPVNKRHLDMVYSHIRYSDKPFMGSVTAPERAEDTVAMAKIVFGDEFVDNNCVHDQPDQRQLAAGVRRAPWSARSRSMPAPTRRPSSRPSSSSGAMSAVTAVGTLTQILAEASVGMAFTQLCRPGAPVMFGTFASSISMQSGAPTFGTPEPAHVLFGAAQLARRLGVPFRSGGALCASKIPDAQAAHESANTLWPTLLAGANFVLHAAGWLEGGLVVVLREVHDRCRPARHAAELCRGRRSLRERPGAGRHPRGRARAAISSAAPIPRPISRPPSGARRSPTTIPSSNGATTARRMPPSAPTPSGSGMLRDYEAPPLDPAIDEALKDFMAKRKEVLPDTVA